MTLNIVLIIILIALTAFFVATEFAIVKLRASRVDQMVIEGRKNALAVRKVTSNLDGYLSACQLGITITALGLGWLGEPTVEKLLYPLFQQIGLGENAGHIVSFAIAFALITFLHVVVGELAPKSIAIQKAELVSVWTAPLIIFFYKLMYPIIWALNGSANALVRLFGLRGASEHEDAHSEEEIRIILSESYESGKINKTEYGYVSNIFAFDELLAREIMVPRTDMACLYTDNSLAEIIAIIKKEQYTRFPVASGSKDNMIGFINTKQFFLQYGNEPDFDMKSLIQPLLTVPEVTPIKTLLTKMQQQRVHIALLLDEYGGTSGLITIEDILEEIVGEIRDEFDADEKKPIEKIGDDRYLVQGNTLIDEINQLPGISIDDAEVDTIGGWLFTQSPDLQKGEQFLHGPVTLIVREREKHRIKKIELVVGAEAPAAH
ncbi:hemolysin family protein [Paenibacillus arenilitoris]|uniref:HlyC/CorC family transporter n=1 Tax=Paenibacillus arenilitoris TaxID=2772299 RepID=A0A927CII7_9BACL|nr:hemolysin family protein [Paenibacillus arenilitoris]MBD2867263.1 HlyC/CorC family transporter [Paenibacillus arenilitoris]